MKQIIKKLAHVSTNSRGFTLVEVIVALAVMGVILQIATTTVSTASTINSKTARDAEASELAFQKLQSYINTEYTSIPIGDDLTSYEVEDFSSTVATEGFANPSAKVYIEPASVVDSTSTTTTTYYDDTTDSDTSATTGAEYTTSGTHDPTGCCRRDNRIRDNNYFNLIYNDRDSGSSNQELTAIDLGSPQPVSNIRINWYSSYYTSTNFRIEGSNTGGSSNSNWTTVASGLSQNSSVGTSIGDYPEDYAVSGTYRYWRMFNVTGTHSTWIAISEMEAFSGNSGDVVEQTSTGTLDFTSSDIDMTASSGGSQNSIGLRFLDVNVPQGEVIDNAYIQFEADESDSGSVQLLVEGIDVDDSAGWSGSYAVDNTLASDATTANYTWNAPSWTAGNDGASQQITVTNIVQEILNRGGWADGNSMAFGITHVSGSDRRVATKSPSPQLVIEWSDTVTTPGSGTYVDVDMDGDADNPTLLKATVTIEYDLQGKRRDVTFSTFIRQHGIGS